MNKKNSSIIVIASILAMLNLYSCNKSSAKNSSAKAEPTAEKIKVAVSIVPEATFAKAVCGNLIDVITMIPPGSSPENYEPTAKQMEDFTDSKIYFAIGVPTEKANIIPQVDTSKTKLVSLNDASAKQYGELKLGNERDPHIWLSPKRAELMVQVIADEVSALDPANTETYKTNAKSFIAQIASADSSIKESLKNVKNRKFVVYHPAFGYFADDYNLEMYALEEEGKESTPKELQEKIDFAKKENIKVIFYQAEIDSNQSEAFAEEVGGRTVKLEPLAADYIGNLQKMADTMAAVMQ